jgi:ribosomal protein L18E
MAISKTKVNERMRNKTNSILAETIFLAKKNNLVDVAAAISKPSRKLASVNLSKINAAKSDVVIVAGKVLSDGNLDRKIKIYALGCSQTAKEKIKKSGCEYKTILEALKKGEKIKGEILN